MFRPVVDSNRLTVNFLILHFRLDVLLYWSILIAGTILQLLLVARWNHLSGCFWLFAVEFWEAVGT